jgi:hypothetical protein
MELFWILWNGDRLDNQIYSKRYSMDLGNSQRTLHLLFNSTQVIDIHVSSPGSSDGNDAQRRNSKQQERWSYTTFQTRTQAGRHSIWSNHIFWKKNSRPCVSISSLLFYFNSIVIRSISDGRDTFTDLAQAKSSVRIFAEPTWLGFDDSSLQTTEYYLDHLVLFQDQRAIAWRELGSMSVSKLTFNCSMNTRLATIFDVS